MILRLSRPSGKPKYAPGVLKCKHCKHIFYRVNKIKICPNCNKQHGNQQAQ